MARGSFQYRLVIWVLRIGLPLLVLLGGLVYAAHKGSLRVVEPLRWYGDVRMEELNFDLSGVVRIKHLAYRPPGMPEESSLEADDVEIRTPGLMWLVSTGLAGPEASGADLRRAWATKANGGPLAPEPRALPPLDHFEIFAQSLHIPSRVWLPKSLHWIGLTTAAPFESLGCGAQRLFGPEDFTGMGVSTDPLKAQLVVDATRDVAHVVLRLGNEQRTRTTWDAQLRMKDATRFVDTDWQAMEPIDEQWRVNDEGFVVGRNRYCAHRLRLSRPTFVDRHVEAVEQRLAELGVAAMPDMIEAYRKFATRGGEISWHAKPKKPIDLGHLSALQREDRVAALASTLAVNGEDAVPFELAPAAPAAPDTAVVAAPATPATGTPPPAKPPTEPAKPPPSATSASASTSPPAPTSSTTPPKTVAASTPQPQPATTPAASKPSATPPLAPTSTATSAAPTTPPSTAPAASGAQVAKATPPKSMQPPPLPLGPVKFDDLGRAIGRTVLVHTSYGTLRSGTVMTFNKIAFTLKTQEHGQELILVLPRGNVKSVELIEPNNG